MLDIPAQCLKGLMERERWREDLFVAKLFISCVIDKLRVCQQFFRSDPFFNIVTGIGTQRTVDNVMFQNLVDQIDIGQNGVGIFTGKLQMFNVRSSLQQYVQRVFLLIDRYVKKMQYIYKIGCRTEP